MKSSSGGSGGGVPLQMNQSTYYQSQYPEANFKGHTFSALQANVDKYISAFNANVTYTPADFPILETVWSTQINAYNKILADAFQTFGNYYANANFWSNTFYRSGWNIQYVAGQTGTFTLNSTVRIASLEALKVWYNVGGTIKFCPAYAMAAGGQNSTYNFTGVTVTYTFKVMRSNGTLVTIWSYTTPTNSTSIWQSQSTQVLLWLQTLTNTPVVSQAGDRIVIEINVACTLNIPNNSGGASGTYPGGIIVYTWYAWSSLWLSASVDAYRPFQISLT